MGLELATYSMTFEWISGAQNKADNCLSRLVKLPNDSKATLPPIWMDQHSTQEAKHHYNAKHPRIQDLQTLYPCYI